MHQPLYLKIDDLALLQLHKEYKIPFTIGVINKLSQQYVGSFSFFLFFFTGDKKKLRGGVERKGGKGLF